MTRCEAYQTSMKHYYSDEAFSNLLLSIANLPEGDLVIQSGQGGEALMGISRRDIIEMRD